LLDHVTHPIQHLINAGRARSQPGYLLLEQTNVVQYSAAAANENCAAVKSSLAASTLKDNAFQRDFIRPLGVVILVRNQVKASSFPRPEGLVNSEIDQLIHVAETLFSPAARLVTYDGFEQEGCDGYAALVVHAHSHPAPLTAADLHLRNDLRTTRTGRYEN
jgi:hypothetical protein